MNKKEEDRSWLRSFGLFGVIISEILVSTGVGIGIGYYAWNHLNAPWWVLLLTSILGLVFAFYRLYLASEKDWK